VTWGAEIVLLIQRKRPGYSHLHVVKDRDGDMGGHRLGLYFDKAGFTIDPESDKTTADKTDELRDAVYRYLRDHAGASQRDVRFAAEIGGSQNRRVDALDSLVADGTVEQSTGGKAGAIEHRIAPDGIVVTSSDSQ
jgi:hypothetical protein